MLDSGMVRESASPWAPIVHLKKEDGSWRFCGLKSTEWAQSGQIVLHIRPCKWLLLSVNGSLWEKTAFTTPFCLCEFERMPFSPRTIQRLMQHCLGNLVNESLLIYLDDVVPISTDKIVKCSTWKRRSQAIIFPPLQAVP